MQKILIFVIGFIGLLLTGYAAYALWGSNSTSPTVKLMGPGSTSSVCVDRLKPNFTLIENSLTEIATALLSSDTIDDFGYGVDHNGNPFLGVNNITGGREATADEMAKFMPLFQSPNMQNYYTPNIFRKREGKVVALSNAKCGLTLFEWVKFRLGSAEPFDGPMTYGTGFIYWPEGVPEFEPCADPSGLKANEGLVCEMPLNGHWSWNSEWVSAPF